MLQKKLALLCAQHGVILVWGRKKAIDSLSGCDWNSGRDADRKGHSASAQTRMRNKSKGHPCYIVVNTEWRNGPSGAQHLLTAERWVLVFALAAVSCERTTVARSCSLL